MSPSMIKGSEVLAGGHRAWLVKSRDCLGTGFLGKAFLAKELGGQRTPCGDGRVTPQPLS